MACILFSCAVRIHDLQVYRKIDVTRERVSHIFEMMKMLPSFQTGLNLINAAVVCAVLESISGLEHLSVTSEPSYLKLVTVSSPDITVPIGITTSKDFTILSLKGRAR